MGSSCETPYNQIEYIQRGQLHQYDHGDQVDQWDQQLHYDHPCQENQGSQGDPVRKTEHKCIVSNLGHKIEKAQEWLGDQWRVLK